MCGSVLSSFPCDSFGLPCTHGADSSREDTDTINAAGDAANCCASGL